MFTYEYSEVNKGEPSQYSAEQRAINEALSNFMFGPNILESDPRTHRYDWSEMTITKLTCNEPRHYPELCWHFLIEIKEQDERYRS